MSSALSSRQEDLARIQIQLSQIARRLNATSDLEAITDLIYRYADRNFSATKCWLFVVNHDLQRVEFQPNRKLKAEDPRVHRWLTEQKISLTPEAGAIYIAVKRKRNVGIPDVSRALSLIDGRLKSLDRVFIDELQLANVLYAPLLLDQEVVGLLGMTGRMEDQPITAEARRDRIRHLRLFCEQAAAALHRARLGQKVAEDQQRLATIGTLAAGLVHDLKNPLSAITSYAEMAEAEADLDTKRDYLQSLSREAERLTGMIHDIQDFARGAPLVNADMYNLGAILNDILDRVRPEMEIMGIRLERRLDFQGEVMIDPGQLRRVMDNLLTNSREALQNPTSVDPWINVATDRTEEGYRITISDNGPGVPRLIRDTLFEPLVTNGKKGGTGMGLWNTHKIVEGHQGRITVHSTPRQGTSFVIDLPLEFDRRQGPHDRRGSDERRLGEPGRRGSDG